jgi:hypothetical protein
MSAKYYSRIILFLVIALPRISIGQSNVILGQDGNRVLQTAVPFLRITPDARAAGMGETGVATAADANSAYWNPAKMVHLSEQYHFAYSFTPWLRKVVSDMSLQHVAGVYKPDEVSALGFSYSYFDLGDIQLAGPGGLLLQIENPNEQALTVSYAREVSRHLSLGINARYIRVESYTTTASANDPGHNFSLDIGALYQKAITTFTKDAILSLGGTVTNLGPKMDYYDQDKLFLPATLRIGAAVTTQLNANHSLSWSVDVSKLLVPTPPIYAINDNGQLILTNPSDPNSPPVILQGKDPNRRWLSGTFGSFTDAPDGLSEELQEVILATGLEYWYKDIVALRGGYFREAIDKGDRRYFTAGLGGRYRFVSLDLAYLFPQGLAGRNHPLQETFRFSLMLRLGSVSGQV